MLIDTSPSLPVFFAYCFTRRLRAHCCRHAADATPRRLRHTICHSLFATSFLSLMISLMPCFIADIACRYAITPYFAVDY